MSLRRLELDASNRIIETLTGSESLTAINSTGSTILANSLVNVYNNSGITTMRLADSSAVQHAAFGFTTIDVADGVVGDILTLGTLSGFVSLIPAQLYWLDPSNPGQLVAAEPTGSGEIAQVVGFASSTTTFQIRIQIPIKLL